ncbi:glutathione synthase [Cyanobium sp. NIES-981]|uniref:glutathione synthase n=1 Tax=Cyanobium sp. NIES-981 TaxID=1851505 RepID=UPI0007DCB9DE|nr:glutathione synthase [Cyanobium sp. NIES-981]SBO44912.1 Glutathione synthetase [Cyanobium sp. NIES-981]
MVTSPALSAPDPAIGAGAQLFVIDPISRLKPAKDSTVALMQAAQRAGRPVWVATPADLSAREAAAGPGHGAWVRAEPVELAAISPELEGWRVPEPWYRLGQARPLPLTAFAHVWMRKDPPVDEAYLYATHLLDLAERQGVAVINRPAALRAWNEKLSSLRWSHLMAPTLVASRVEELAAFTGEHAEVVLKPLGGRAGQGVVFASAASPGLRALLELVTAQEQLPVMVQAFLPGVKAGDKRILLVDGEPLGAVNRVPSGGEFRSNLAVGGAPEATDLTEQERRICAELAPALRAEGLFFVGIDVIDGRLSEINVTSPTGIREVERLGGLPLADLTLEKLPHR